MSGTMDEAKGRAKEAAVCLPMTMISSAKARQDQRRAA